MVNIFLDTDFGPDCDDAGALQVIHTLCDRGEARLLGVTHCTSSPWGLPAVSAVNRYNGREVPLGTTPRRGFLDGEECLRYTRPLAGGFDHAFRGGVPQRGACEVFAEVLDAQPDASVTVLAIGPLNNLADFLRAGGGPDRIRRKVARLVAMAGRFSDAQPEWNVEMDVDSARYVLENWPTPVVLCGWECGADVLTGAGLEDAADSPVREAYRLWTGGLLRRPSFDPLTALYAVEGDSFFLGTRGPGRITVQSDGSTRFTPLPGGPHRYVVNRADSATLAAYVDSLLRGKYRQRAAS